MNDDANTKKEKTSLMVKGAISMTAPTVWPSDLGRGE